jgi:hypothetical protein
MAKMWRRISVGEENVSRNNISQRRKSKRNGSSVAWRRLAYDVMAA